MKTIRIRKFTILSLFIILTLPWLFFVFAHFIDTKTLSLGKNETQQRNLDKSIQFIETNTKNWKRPKWQNQLKSQLKKTHMGVSILSASNQEVFRFIPEQNHSFKTTEQFSIIEDGQVLGKVVFYLPNLKLIQMIAAFTGLLLAFFIVGFEMRRFILKPLEKMSLAARQIAKGDLDVQLPVARITEIAEVGDGFNVMVRGLKESFQKQIEMEEERRFVISSVAHDLRTPLFALRGYLDGLDQGIAHSPEKQAKYLTICKEKSAQLDRLVEELFTYTKMEYLEMDLNKKLIDLKHVLLKSLDSLRLRAQQKNISIIMNDFQDDCMIMGDSYLLERTMNNILDNAVRHTPIDGRIVVLCYQDKKNVTFTFQDSGPGFTSEELQHVFDPLFRGEVSRNRSTGGVGLGLTISQKIIRRHGGDLTVKNHTDGGALVTGWIPIAFF
ncbi:HAMP domain-containing histidine kinase [Bacillus sp. APMAM]|nr:HAMP domain-containing histidine kinase [Bacillus sp. APMAM]RTZ53679.1 HAMP domain-containing histidine kinase [Bacillus sp. SAJ1]